MCLQGHTHPQDSFSSCPTVAFISPTCRFILTEFYFQLLPVIKDFTVWKTLTGAWNGSTFDTRCYFWLHERAEGSFSRKKSWPETSCLFASQSCLVVHFSPPINICFICSSVSVGRSCWPETETLQWDPRISWLLSASTHKAIPVSLLIWAREFLSVFIFPTRRRLRSSIALLVSAVPSLQRSVPLAA